MVQLKALRNKDFLSDGAAADTESRPRLYSHLAFIFWLPVKSKVMKASHQGTKPLLQDGPGTSY